MRINTILHLRDAEGEEGVGGESVGISINFLHLSVPPLYKVSTQKKTDYYLSVDNYN